MRNIFAPWALLVLAVFVVGCGGSGGSKAVMPAISYRSYFGHSAVASNNDSLEVNLSLGSDGTLNAEFSGVNTNQTLVSGSVSSTGAITNGSAKAYAPGGALLASGTATGKLSITQLSAQNSELNGTVTITLPSGFSTYTLTNFPQFHPVVDPE